MDVHMHTLIIAIAALIAGIAIGLTAAVIKRQDARISALEAVDAKRHLPYPAADAIEDGLAALLPILYDDDLKRDRINNAIAHFQKARNWSGGRDGK